MDIKKDIKGIEWSQNKKLEFKNSQAVVDAVNRAAGFKLPVEDKYMQRLKQYKNQVLPMSYPVCPLGWQRHTSQPPAADAMGVAWLDADGYFCGPPDASPETLYKEDDHAYESQAALNKRIQDLTLEIKHTLNPTEYEKEITEMKERSAKQQTAYELSAKAKKIAQTEEDANSRKKNVEKLTKIYKDHGFMALHDAKTAADALYNAALECVKPGGDGKGDCTKVYDGADDKNIKTYYVPTILYVEDIAMATPVQLKGLAWWREFRRLSASKKLIKDRKSLAMYV